MHSKIFSVTYLQRLQKQKVAEKYLFSVNVLQIFRHFVIQSESGVALEPPCCVAFNRGCFHRTDSFGTRTDLGTEAMSFFPCALPEFVY